MIRRMAWLPVLLVLAACNQARVVEDQAYAGPTLPRPDRILVYDFAVAPAETMGAGAAAGHLATAAASTAGMHAISERRAAGDDDNAVRIARGLAIRCARAARQPG